MDRGCPYRQGGHEESPGLHVHVQHRCKTMLEIHTANLRKSHPPNTSKHGGMHTPVVKTSAKK